MGRLMVEQKRNEMVLSFYRVRTALGLLGILLPIVLIVGGLIHSQRIEPSLSDFYHTVYRDVFVGTLCAIGVFLISYRGYQLQTGELFDDNWVATAAGVAAFGVALFPNEGPPETLAVLREAGVLVGTSPMWHYISALVFFSCLADFCFKFARTAKKRRRPIYLTCGWIIIAMLVAIAVASAIKIYGSGPARDIVVGFKAVLWFEAVGIWAFGISWLVKGRADIALANLTGAKVLAIDDAKLPES